MTNWEKKSLIDGLQAPSLSRRMACWAYEGLLLFGVVFVSGYLFSALTQTRHGLQNRHELQAFLFVIFGIYFVWLWSKGQTLAMKTWRIRVVNNRGENLSQTHALARYVLSWVWFLPPLGAAWWGSWSGAQALVVTSGWIVCWAILSLLHPRGQFWHDALAGTQLIDSQAPKKPAA